MLPKLNIADTRFTKRLLIGILFFAFAVCVAAIFIIGDTKLDHEYATLIPNPRHGKGYILFAMPWVFLFAASAIAIFVDKILQKIYGHSTFMHE